MNSIIGNIGAPLRDGSLGEDDDDDHRDNLPNNEISNLSQSDEEIRVGMASTSPDDGETNAIERDGTSSASEGLA